jgi:hypothetical protein
MHGGQYNAEKMSELRPVRREAERLYKSTSFPVGVKQTTSA